MKRIISIFIAVTIALMSAVLPAYATGTVTDNVIGNLGFSDDTKTLSWTVGTGYGSANVYKYNADGSIELLGNTTVNSYTYTEAGTYIVRPVLTDGTELEGKVITTVASGNAINITKMSSTEQGVYTIDVENITGHYLRCKAVLQFFDASENVIKYGYGKSFITPYMDNEVKFVMNKPEGTARTEFSIYDDLGNSLADLGDASYLGSVITSNQEHITEIENLLARCEEKGISTDYETINFKVMERFDTYLQEDLANSQFENTYYTASALDKLYNEAKENLEAYLAETKVPRKVPKYVTSDMRIDGDSVYATTELDGVTEERPVFFIGYGHFSQAAKDMPLFNKIGANTIQTEIGPTDVMIFSEFDSWEFNASNGPTYTAEISSELAQEGTKSLKITYGSPLTDNQFITFSQYVPVEPGKTYNFNGYVNTQSATNSWFSLEDWDERKAIDANSNGWEEISATYTAPADAIGTTIRINCDATCTAMYLDGLTFTEEGSNVNLLHNGGFETINTKDYQVMANSVKLAELKRILKDAEENNIAVSVLLSPHYFPESIIEEYDIAHTGDPAKFLNYNVNADIAREIIEEYLRVIIPEIKDYPALNNICISNEPFFKPESCGDYYLSDWRQFLKDKYGSIVNLNSAYGTWYITYNQVKLDTSNKTKEYDYKLFNDMIFSEWHRWMAGIIKEYTDVPLHSKIMAYVADDDTADRMKRGVGYEKYYDFLELNGCDAHNYINDGSGLYLVDDGYLVEEMWYDYMRSIKDAPVINSEDHIIPDGSKNYADEVADYVAQNMYMGAIHGRAISDIWVWERSYNEESTFYSSVLHRPDVIAAIGRETLNLNRNAYEITALQDAAKEVGILYSDSSILRDTSASYAMYQAYSACLYSGKAVQFVTPSQLSKMNDCKVLIVPQATYVTADTLTYIKSFIENGRKVMIIGQNSLKKNEKNENNDSDTLDYIIDNSYVLNYDGTKGSTGSITEAQLYDEIRTVLKSANIYNVVVKDANSGETVDYVEYNVGTYNDNTIINLISYEEDKDVNIYIDGTLVSSSYDINNCVELSDTISLKRYVPVTVRISK